MNTHATSIFKDKNVASPDIPADKVPNNSVYVCKLHLLNYLINELGIENSLGNSTHTPRTLT